MSLLINSPSTAFNFQNFEVCADVPSIHGMLIIEPKIFADGRGWFFESFNENAFFKAVGLNSKFAQDNHSFSHYGVLRGLHYQLKHPQGKLVRAVSGSIFNVTVDVRKLSPTYGRWFGIEVSALDRKQLWIPPGIAHGFLVISDGAEVLYKATDFYDPQSEVCLAWNDPTAGVEWPLPEGVLPSISTKDAAGLSWDAIPKF